jgi:hypothetical protein
MWLCLWILLTKEADTVAVAEARFATCRWRRRRRRLGDSGRITGAAGGTRTGYHWLGAERWRLTWRFTLDPQILCLVVLAT